MQKNSAKASKSSLSFYSQKIASPLQEITKPVSNRLQGDLHKSLKAPSAKQQCPLFPRYGKIRLAEQCNPGNNFRSDQYCNPLRSEPA